MTEFRRTGESVVHEGYIWNVVVADFEGPDGLRFQRDVVRSPGAVGVVPLEFDAEGQALLTLVRQYRAAFEDELVEVPAGMRDVVGEPPEETARRELAEEVGLVAERLEMLGEIQPSPGMTDATTVLFVATGLSHGESDAQGPEEESMELLRLPLAEAVAMVDDGRIRDAKTVASILWLERRLRDGTV